MTTVERFWAKVDRGGDDECWLWMASTNGHYGKFWDGVAGRLVYAHRYAYELLVGPIPDGLQIDHVRSRGCTSKLCVNPVHLEPVTSLVNLRRGPTTVTAINAAKTHCPQGHPYDEANTMIVAVRRGVGRICRSCSRDRARRLRATRSAA